MEQSNNKTFQFNVLKTPRLMYIGTITQKKIFFSTHTHKDVAEFVYIKNANGVIRIKGKAVNIGNNSLVIFNPNIEHEEMYNSIDGNDIELFYFAITDYVVNSNKNSDILPSFTPITVSVDDTTFDSFKYTLNKIIDEFALNKLGYEHLVSALCMQLYIETLRLFNKNYQCFSSLYDTKDVVTENIKKYIDENFSDPALSIVNLEKILHISHYYLSRIFKKKSGITIKDYLIQTRMSFAAKKLLNSQSSVTEIAKESGYNDIYHFFKEFKKRYGVSPSTYRKTHSKKS